MPKGKIICGSCGQEMKFLYAPAQRIDRKSWAVVLALTIGCSAILVAALWWAFA
jgi:hypothetical protein